jgi:organic radical activating enzyme
MTEEEKYAQHIKNTRDELNEVSPSYCVAKWKQVTMHLQNGHTHSFHHPRTHLVPIEELKNNYKALHNTSYKKQQRKLMLEGVRPSECDYCWRAEDAGNISDRTYKSADHSWAYGHLKELPKQEWNADIDPSYVEISFSSVCNFKCSYCSPNISSQWMEEIERHGAYPTSNKFNNIQWFQQNDQIPIPNNQDNPYVVAFWEWWPTMYKELKQFRITGGEPLLTKNTFKVLDYIIENPANIYLTFSVNTNMNVPDELYSKFIEKLKIIQDQGKIGHLQIFTSAEAYGAQAEYIRNGMNYEQWLKNLHRMINEVPRVAITIMSTYNLLSVPSYKQFLQDMLDIRLQYRDIAYKNNRNPVALDMPYLRHPLHQASFIIPEYLLHYVEEQIKFMEEHREPSTPGQEYTGFYENEIYKLRRIYNIIKAEIDSGNDNTTNRKDFVLFVDEHDRRRGTNFLETYPQLTQMYNEWKSLLT